MLRLFKNLTTICLVLFFAIGLMALQNRAVSSDASEQATGQVEGNLPEAAGVNVRLCDSVQPTLPGTPAECNGTFESETVIDSTGRFLIPFLPSGDYYILFDIPDPTKVKSTLCRQGEFYGRDAISSGAREFCLDGTTLGPTVSVQAGKVTGYPSQTDATSETPILGTPESTQQATSLGSDSSKILFTSNRDGNFEVYSMNADGSNPVNLTNNPADDEVPVWSPDGKQIAFTSRRDGNAEIYVMNADGSNPVNLTNNPADDEVPVWSPDGTKIAFVSYRDGNNEIYVMNADGSNPVNLTNNLADDRLPAWR